MKIIAIHGYAGTGKDTAAAVLIEHKGFIKRAFATPLYAQVSEAYGVTTEFFANRATKETPLMALALIQCKDFDFLKLMLDHSDHSVSDHDYLTQPRSPRWTMQQWGTEYRRVSSGNQNYWINDMEAFIKQSRLDQVSGLVIPDLRLITEYDFIHQVGGQVWHIVKADVNPVNFHSTEVKLDVNPGDRLIHNDFSKKELEITVNQLIADGERHLKEKSYAPKI